MKALNMNVASSYYFSQRQHAGVVLLCHMESLHLLVHPGGLPGVALHN